MPFSHLASYVFSSTLCTKLGLPHHVDLEYIHCIYGELLDLAGTHLIYCSHGGDQIIFHDAIRDVFASIVKDMGFHVSHEQIHVLLSPSF
jgi:hypothetical protein